jgi:hypothetical protein
MFVHISYGIEQGHCRSRLIASPYGRSLPLRTVDLPQVGRAIALGRAAPRRLLGSSREEEVGEPQRLLQNKRID